MKSIKEEEFVNVSGHHYEDFNTHKNVFNHLNPNEKEKEISNFSQGATQDMIKDEGSVDRGEFHTTFIPTWCLDASDDDFLCGEDLPIHSSLIINDENSFVEVDSL